MNWSEQVVLVTGGTGSFGKKFAELMLREYRPQKLIISAVTNSGGYPCRRHETSFGLRGQPTRICLVQPAQLCSRHRSEK